MFVATLNTTAWTTAWTDVEETRRLVTLLLAVVGSVAILWGGFAIWKCTRRKPEGSASLPLTWTEKLRMQLRVTTFWRQQPPRAQRSDLENGGSQQGTAPMGALAFFKSKAKEAKAARHQQSYKRLVEYEEVGRERRNTSALRRPRCDMLLMWKDDEGGEASGSCGCCADDEAEKQRMRKEKRKERLDLISERLFVYGDPDARIHFLQGGPAKSLRVTTWAWTWKPWMWFRQAEKQCILKVSTVRPPLDDTPDSLAKEVRIDRLFRRLATRDEMNKRLRNMDTTKRLQPLTQSCCAEKKARTMLPFDERLQPMRDDDPRLEHGVFKHAPNDEKLEPDRAELFTSMERIRLLRLVLETPEADGGCEVDLGQAEEEGWFTVVPVHDGTRALDGTSRCLCTTSSHSHAGPQI